MFKKDSTTLFLLFVLSFISSLSAQQNGDFRSRSAGVWSDHNTWQVYSGIGWADAQEGSIPSSNNMVFVMSDHYVIVDIIEAESSAIFFPDSDSAVLEISEGAYLKVGGDISNSKGLPAGVDTLSIKIYGKLTANQITLYATGNGNHQLHTSLSIGSPDNTESQLIVDSITLSGEENGSRTAGSSLDVFGILELRGSPYLNLLGLNNNCYVHEGSEIILNSRQKQDVSHIGNMPGYTNFSKLSIKGGGRKHLVEDIYIDSSLSLTSGRIVCGNYSIYYADDAILIYDDDRPQRPDEEWMYFFNHEVSISNTKKFFLDSDKVSDDGRLTVTGLMQTGGNAISGSGTADNYGTISTNIASPINISLTNHSGSYFIYENEVDIPGGSSFGYLELIANGLYNLAGDITILDDLLISSGLLSLNYNSICFPVKGFSLSGASRIEELTASVSEESAILGAETTSISRKWDISISGDISPLVSLSWPTSADNGNFFQNPANIWLYDGNNWVFVTQSPVTTIDNQRSVTFSYPLNNREDVSGEFTISGDSQALPVELSSFAVHNMEGSNVQIIWSTESETNFLGYNIYRSDSDSLSEALKLNLAIVAGKNSSTPSTYTFLDDSAEFMKTYHYWLEAVDLDLSFKFHGPVSIYVIDSPDGEYPLTPKLQTELIGAFPNPFNPGTRIMFSLRQAASITIEVYNIRGQLIETLIKEEVFPEGIHTVYWNGKDNYGNDCVSGVFIQKMTAENDNGMYKKMLLLR